MTSNQIRRPTKLYNATEVGRLLNLGRAAMSHFHSGGTKPPGWYQPPAYIHGRLETPLWAAAQVEQMRIARGIEPANLTEQD